MAEEIKHIVRIAGHDLDGKKAVHHALLGIKGVSFSLARAVAYAANIDPFRKIGTLTEEEVKKIEDVLKDPLAHGIPAWMLNRRKDYETGKDTHLVGPEIDFYVKMDIDREKRIRSRRGIRHELGLPVRGQRTRTTGRRGMTVGVVRKKGAQPKAEEKEEKKK
ncbi:MAG: 30S ribosomal protein S13 [Candidatus Hadarchaeales archaeon]